MISSVHAMASMNNNFPKITVRKIAPRGLRSGESLLAKTVQGAGTTTAATAAVVATIASGQTSALTQPSTSTTTVQKQQQQQRLNNLAFVASGTSGNPICYYRIQPNTQAAGGAGQTFVNVGGTPGARGAIINTPRAISILTPTAAPTLGASISPVGGANTSSISADLSSPSAASAGSTSTPTPTTKMVRIAPGFAPVAHPTGIQILKTMHSTIPGSCTFQMVPASSVVNAALPTSPIVNRKPDSAPSSGTSLLQSPNDVSVTARLPQNVQTKRVKKLPSKLREEESLLASPPPPKKRKSTGTNRSRKSTSLLQATPPTEDAPPSGKKGRKGRKPKGTPVITPGMKKTKNRLSGRMAIKEKKNKTSLVPLSRVSQIMRSVPSLTTLKPDAVAVTVHAAELFVRKMIKNTQKFAKDPSVLDYKAFQEYISTTSYDFLKMYTPKPMTPAEALAKQKAFIEAQQAKLNGNQEDDDDDDEEEEEEDDDEEEEDAGEEQNDTAKDEEDEDEEDDDDGEEEGGEEQNDTAKDEEEEEEEEDDDDGEEEAAEENTIEEDIDLKSLDEEEFDDHSDEDEV